MNQLAREALRRALIEASDELIRSPLWGFPPNYRRGVLSERARRGFLNNDPEPIGDAEYS